MSRSLLRVALLLLSFIGLTFVTALDQTIAAEQATEAEQLFVRRILPILNDKCFACHGNDVQDIQGGLNLRAQDALTIGGDTGEPLIKREDLLNSPLLSAVKREDANWSPMPPKDADRLTSEQLKHFSQWIEAGAVWPNASRIAEIQKSFADKWSIEDGWLLTTSGGLSAEWNDRRYKPEALWAYQPVRKPVTKAEGSGAIDELIALHVPDGMSVAGESEPATWLRRATYDLTGLPATNDEIRSFETAFHSNKAIAVREAIDRLLSSPHYGEQMAQHWLDVVRYADSSGFANDFERGNAWRYRDYVVRSFNNDKAYDRFIREQIAGDEIDPSDSENIIATGFLRMGPWELTGMEVAKIARQRFLDDVTNSVGEVFLAHSLQCARCHDHKFDPIPTRDYYSIQAVFSTTHSRIVLLRFFHKKTSTVSTKSSISNACKLPIRKRYNDSMTNHWLRQKSGTKKTISTQPNGKLPSSKPVKTGFPNDEDFTGQRVPSC